MIITLQRSARLESYEALLEIGRQETREELRSVLLLAQERGGRVTPGDVCEHLLIGRPESVGKAVLDRCRAYSLLGPSGELTERGSAALDSGKVFIPERWKYRLWYTEDPLLPQRLLDLEPLRELSLRDEVVTPPASEANPKPPSSREKEEVINLPEGLRSLENGVFDLLGPSGDRVQVISVEPRGIRRALEPRERVVVSLELGPERPAELKVQGLYDRTLPSPKVDYSQVWLAVLGDQAQYWNNSSNPACLQCVFEDLRDDERSSFRKTLRIVAPSFPDLGKFDATEVSEVPIAPRTSRDANEWAAWHLGRGIGTYVDEEGYRAIAEEVRAKFPGFKLGLPDHGQMIQRLRAEQTEDGRLPEGYWYLQAPSDLREKRAQTPPGAYWGSPVERVGGST